MSLKEWEVVQPIFKFILSLQLPPFPITIHTYLLYSYCIALQRYIFACMYVGIMTECSIDSGSRLVGLIILIIFFHLRWVCSESVKKKLSNYSFCYFFEPLSHSMNSPAAGSPVWFHGFYSTLYLLWFETFVCVFESRRKMYRANWWF